MTKESEARRWKMTKGKEQRKQNARGTRVTTPRTPPPRPTLPPPPPLPTHSCHCMVALEFVPHGLPPIKRYRCAFHNHDSYGLGEACAELDSIFSISHVIRLVVVERKKINLPILLSLRPDGNPGSPRIFRMARDKFVVDEIF